MFGFVKTVPIWWILAGVAFVIRFVAAIVAGGFDQPEVFEYEYAARELIQGRGLTYPHLGITYHSYLPPLYVWICAGIYLLTGGATSAVLLVQMLVAAAHTLLVFKVANHLMGRSAGIVSGLLIAVHPGLIVYSSLKLHPLVFDAFFFTLLLWQFVRLREDGSVTRFAAAGVIGGLGMLSRSTMAILLPLGCLWLLVTSVSRRQEWVPWLGRCALVGVCATVVVTPWAIRNARIHQEFVPFVTAVGEVFWRGNNLHATGHSYVDTDGTVLDTLPPSARAELQGLATEIEQSNWFRDRAFSFIVENPGEFVRLTATKFFYFWWFSPQSGTEYPRSWLFAYQAYYAFLVVLAMTGIWVVGRGNVAGRWLAVLLVVFMLAISSLQSLYYVEGRHRWGVEPFLLILTGAGISHVLQKNRNRQLEKT